ncbi:MAG: TlyA family RNA methyltransferase [Clostridia bacterium]|nr:TlyA family RNA methyltransferase [Clostridia bacterium]
MTEKTRADVALVNRGLAESREKAQAAIMAGLVFIGERRVMKASEPVRPEDNLLMRQPENTYVSRGALKLEKAVRVFNADLKERVILDAGASTGGFTDVCLRYGARHVYAVDVGYGQLDWKLRNDPRVTVMERTNARFLTADMFPEKPEIAVMDVSFISIRLILPALTGIIGDQGIIYSLIKPQFEAGRDKVGKKGVVRDPKTHEEVIRTISEFARSIGWCIRYLDYSPITGPEGNIEFLSEIRKADDPSAGITDNDIRSVVAEAHRKLTNEQGDGHL